MNFSFLFFLSWLRRYLTIQDSPSNSFIWPVMPAASKLKVPVSLCKPVASAC